MVAVVHDDDGVLYGTFFYRIFFLWNFSTDPYANEIFKGFELSFP